MTDNVETPVEQVASEIPATQDIATNEPIKTVNEFAVPEQYKERGWTKNIKSIDDLYKSYDNAQSLIGKKTVMPEAPADYKDYGIDGIDENFLKMFHEAGLPKDTAKKLIDTYNKVFGEQEKEYQKQFDIEDFKTNLVKEISDVQGLNNVHDRLQDYVNEEALKKIPNDTKIGIYKAMYNLMKDYGANEPKIMGAESTKAVAVDTRESLDKEFRETIKLVDQASNEGRMAEAKRLEGILQSITARKMKLRG